MQMEQTRKIDENFITLEHVDKEFEKVKEGGAFQVVRDLSINVRENEFLVLFGPGQCGKTTILNMIAGFQEPTAGMLRMKGKEIHGPDPSRGMVFQNLAIFPWLTVMGNVEYGLRMKGVDKKTRRARAVLY